MDRQKIRTWFLAKLALILAVMDWADDVASEFVDDLLPDRTPARGQVGAIITIVVLGIVMLIGILIYSQIQSSLPQPNNAELQNASQNVTDQFGSAMELAPVILIVLIASVVLAVVQQFR